MPTANPIYDPAKRLIRFPTVDLKDTWPKAPSEFVFIFEAINLVGHGLFGDAWTGNELTAVSWLESPRQLRALARMARPSPPIPHSLARPYSLPPAKSEPIEHVKDWQVERLHEHWEANDRARERLYSSIDWIAQRCRDGDLVAFWRLRSAGGHLRPMGAHEWNVDSPLFAFVQTGGNKRYCHEFKSPGPYETYVFFDRAQLLANIRQEPDAPLIVGEADLSRLSPYLQCAVRLALKKGYTSREACESNPVREAEIRAAWPELLPNVTITNNAVEAMVRVIGFPDNKAIETGLRAKSGKQGGTPQR